jgi:host factor-I protein
MHRHLPISRVSCNAPSIFPGVGLYTPTETRAPPFTQCFSVSRTFERVRFRMRDNQKLQNDFLNQLRKNATPVSVFLMTGERLDGQIKSFDIYSLSMNCPEPRLVVKSVIATVQPAPKRARKAPSKRSAPRENKRPVANVLREHDGLVADRPREDKRFTADETRAPRKAPEVVTKRRRLTIPKT